MQKYHLIINDETSTPYAVGKLAETIMLNGAGEKMRNLNLSLYDDDSAENKENNLLKLSDFCVPNSIKKLTVTNDSGTVIYQSQSFSQFNSCAITLHDIGEPDEFNGAEYTINAVTIISKE